mgnify:CR=1 FL=1
MFWAAPMRAAASRRRRGWDHAKLRACRVVALCNVQLSARDARLTNKGAVMGEAAVLVSRRTALRTTYGLLGERLRDHGYLGPVTQNDASVLQPAS